MTEPVRKADRPPDPLKPPGWPDAIPDRPRPKPEDPPPPDARGGEA